MALASRTAAGFERVAVTARFLEIYGWAETGATVVLVPTKLAQDIQQIKLDDDLTPSQKQQMIDQAALGAVQSGLMLLGGAVAARSGAEVQGRRRFAEEDSTALKQQIDLIEMEGFGKYKSMADRGWVDEHGNWTDKAPDIVRQKPAAPTGPEAKPVPKPEPMPKPAAEPKTKPDVTPEAEPKPKPVTEPGTKPSVSEEGKPTAGTVPSPVSITAKNARLRATELAVEHGKVLAKRPRLHNELSQLQTEIAAAGTKVTNGQIGRLQYTEARLRRLGEIDRLSNTPPHYRVDEVSLEPGTSHRAPNVVPHPPEVLEFPDGTRIWRDRKGGPVRHESPLGTGEGRAHLEEEHYAQGEHGNLPPLPATKYGGRTQNWERAHTLGQGTGFENPYALYYAPTYVNQALQNEGIEALFRTLVKGQRPGSSYRVSTETSAHAGTRRLSEIRYRVEVIENGQAHGFLEYTIRVSNTDPITISAPALRVETNPVAQAHIAGVEIPPVLSQPVQVTLQ